MERKRNRLGATITTIFAFGVTILVIVAIAKAIAGEPGTIAWLLGTILFIGFIAWKVGCFQRKNK